MASNALRVNAPNLYTYSDFPMVSSVFMVNLASLSYYNPNAFMHIRAERNLSEVTELKNHGNDFYRS